MSKKKQLGQFNTTNKDYILAGFESFIPGKQWVDPFAGNGDLLYWAESHGATAISGFDVDESKTTSLVGYRNSLRNPLDYTGKWVIANPPYLARNKNHTDTIYVDNNQDDLYKIALKTIMGAEGGILILPLNFLSSIEAKDIRNLFFSTYRIEKCKVFEKPVFDDTSYTVCAFYFERGHQDHIGIEFIGFEGQKTYTYSISEKHHWILGEEFYEHLADAPGIGRWTVDNVNDKVYDNIILVRAIDTGTLSGAIGLKDIRTVMDPPVYLGLKTSRTLAHIKFDEPPTLEVQLKIINHVNMVLAEFREKYNSVFLTAYRNSTKWGSRKRIGFDIMYRLIHKARMEIE